MKTIIKNEEAQAGVGTLIIFIAMVLVAAVAAAVLIQTSGVMQSKSTSTTKEAAAAIGENIGLEAVDGYKTTTTAANLSYLNITIKVAAGGSDIDLTKILVKVNGQNYNFTAYSTTNITSNTFWVYSLREAASGAADISYLGTNNYASTTSTLKPGGLARIDVNVGSLSPTLGARSTITLALTPEKGSTLNMPLTVPALGSAKIVPIYP